MSQVVYILKKLSREATLVQYGTDMYTYVVGDNPKAGKGVTMQELDEFVRLYYSKSDPLTYQSIQSRYNIAVRCYHENIEYPAVQNRLRLIPVNIATNIRTDFGTTPTRPPTPAAKTSDTGETPPATSVEYEVEKVLDPKNVLAKMTRGKYNEMLDKERSFHHGFKIVPGFTVSGEPVKKIVFGKIGEDGIIAQRWNKNAVKKIRVDVIDALIKLDFIHEYTQTNPAQPSILAPAPAPAVAPISTSTALIPISQPVNSLSVNTGKEIGITIQLKKYRFRVDRLLKSIRNKIAKIAESSSDEEVGGQGVAWLFPDSDDVEDNEEMTAEQAKYMNKFAFM